MKLVQVWIEHPVRQLDQPFTYLSQESITPGTRVSVLFNGRRVIGFTESCQDTAWSPEEAEKNLGFRLQYIESVLDQESLITPELHDLALWMARETLSPVISCFQAMLPGKIKPASSRKAVVMEDWVKAGGRMPIDLTPRQQEAFAYLQTNGEIPYRELRRRFPNQAKELVDKGAAEIRSREKEAGVRVSAVRTEPFALSQEQARAMQEIETTSDSVYLIRGVTGSGKTEIYLQLARKVLDAGRQVLILVPEISLTPQMIERVEQRFGQDLAIYHSALNPQQKYEQYRKVKSGKAAIVVGTRSAVFLPFSDLGLIVMDEEQDSSYKQENQPAYHCRDVAIQRGKNHHCKVILGSATPALESYARGLKGVYHLVELNERINKSLPKVTIVPLQEAMRKGQSYILSDALSAKMQERLAAHRQIILLLNRRGYSNLLRCRSCHEALLCPHCDIAMSYHRDERLLKCHTCGYQTPVPAACPKCGSTAGFTSQGYGTERLEQEVQKKFPAARILRMDADTTGRKDSHEKILTAFARGEADILLGTQMIAKGLDYPHVTLVGILNGDEGLNRTDFRSCETTFDLLMQAAGRSGRAEEEGEVVFQVYDSSHYAVQCAARQDYVSFFRREMQFRHAGGYPPYTYLISLIVQGKDSRHVNVTALWVKQHLNGSFKTIGVIGLLKINDLCRSRILLKGRDLEEMRRAVRDLLAADAARGGELRIDVSPMVLD